MSTPTSCGGRPQLSAENANSVSRATPRSGAASTTRRVAAMPASCPAERGRPRRVAQRPLPSMMMATCSFPFRSEVLCIAESPGKKNSSRRLEAMHARRIRPGGGCRVAHHLLEHRQIVEIALAALPRDPAQRLRAVVVVALFDVDEPGILQDLQMAAEIAVRQPAHALEVAEGQPLRMCHQRGEHAQARLLVG